MHAAAVFVLVSLVAQPIAYVVCELGCAESFQSSNRSAATALCHEDQLDGQPAASVSASDVLCHGPAGPPTATVADAQKVGATPAVFASAFSLIESRRQPLAGISNNSPDPRRLPLTRQLRI